MHPTLAFRICLFSLALAGCWLLAPAHANAQQQERTLFDRLLHPNQDLHAEGFDKSFTGQSKGTDKTAVVHPFPFSHDASGQEGKSFQVRNFMSGKDKFAVAAYATKPSALANRGLTQADRTFDTKAVPISDAREAGKSAPVRPYGPGAETFYPHGKRQELLDDLRRQKNMTIDEVRELLNKN